MRKIYICDDDLNLMFLLENILEDYNYIIKMFESSKGLLEEMKKSLPDLILLDIKLRKESGIEVCKNLKNNPNFSQIPVVFMTSDRQIETLSEAFANGGDDYIKKPIIKEELLARITNLINVYSLQKKINNENNLYKQTEKLFTSLVETTVGLTGNDFFNNIVKNLAEWLNIECVFIGTVLDKNKLNIKSMYLNNRISTNNHVFNLKGTPCENTLSSGYLFIPINIEKKYSAISILKDFNPVGYIGITLVNSKGKPFGVLSGFSNKKIIMPRFGKNIIKMIGNRVTEEFERKQVIEKLRFNKELNNQNKKLSEIIKQVEYQKETLFKQLAEDIEITVVPIIKKIKTEKEFSSYLIDRLEKVLYNLIGEEGKKYRNCLRKLTSREKEICDFIRSNYISKEIADKLNISVQAVKFHRQNIRKKLNITDSSDNLFTFLTNLK